MKCPKCGGKICVLDSRQPDKETVWRRRACLECGHRFNTEERVLPPKKGGSGPWFSWKKTLSDSSGKQ